MVRLCLTIGFAKSRQTYIFNKKGMSEGGYKIRNQAAIHFITFSVVEWVDVFIRKNYQDIVLDSIRFCQLEKGLLLHCWCIMSNLFLPGVSAASPINVPAHVCRE